VIPCTWPPARIPDGPRGTRASAFTGASCAFTWPLVVSLPGYSNLLAATFHDCLTRIVTCSSPSIRTPQRVVY